MRMMLAISVLLLIIQYYGIETYRIPRSDFSVIASQFSLTDDLVGLVPDLSQPEIPPYVPGEPEIAVDPVPVAPDPIVPEPVDPPPIVPEPADSPVINFEPMDSAPIIRETTESTDPAPIVPEPIDPPPIVPDPVDPPPVVPEPIDPEPVEPTSTDLTPSESVEPAFTDPTSSESIEPTGTDSDSTEPAFTNATSSEPGEPVSTDPTSGAPDESASTDPTPSESVEPASTDSGPSESASTDVTPNQPGESTPANSQQVESSITVDPILRQQLIEYEGNRQQVYTDTQGHPTIGVGFNLDRSDARAALQAVGADYDKVRANEQQLTQSQIDQLLADDIQTATTTAQNFYNGFAQLNPVRQRVLIDMAFNMGANTLNQFQGFRNALEQGDYESAAQGMLDSEWAKQVGNRATTLAEQMRTGQ